LNEHISLGLKSYNSTAVRAAKQTANLEIGAPNQYIQPVTALINLNGFCLSANLPGKITIRVVEKHVLYKLQKMKKH